MKLSRRDFVAAAILCSGSGMALAADSGAQEGGGPDEAVYVVAVIETKPGARADFIEIFKSNLPNVHANEGCVYYVPVVDFDSGIGAQQPLRADKMTVMEKWDSLADLKAHLGSEYMTVYRERVQDLVEGVELYVMREA